MPDIYKYLDNLEIEYVRQDHPAIFTVEEAKIAGYNGPGHTKNLFLRNKKGDKYYLVAIDHNKRVDLKKLEKLLGESRLSLASPKRLKKYLGIIPGSVTLLSLVNDLDHEVQVIIDNELWRSNVIYAHPLINTATLEIKREDVEKFIRSTAHDIKFVDI